MAADQELEIKFYLKDLREVEDRVRELGANHTSIRTFEINLRFDTPDGSLSASQKVLRLRQDTIARLTFKGPSQNRQDVTARQEIEFQVSDFSAGRRFLEALGYQVSVIYEKYRNTYEKDNVQITLDELPYGKFCEIEGPDAASIQAMAERLGLDWSARIMDSYMVMFARLKEGQGLQFRDLTFANFEGLRITPQDLGVKVGDQKQ